VTPTATNRPPTKGVFGVQVFEADVEPIHGGLLNSAGARWARAHVLWAAVEPRDTTPRTRNWAMSDSLIGVTAARGLELIVTIYKNPDWAATTSCGPVDRVPLARYAEFVRDTVERYDGDGIDDAPGHPRVTHWEISNEPDFDRDVRLANPDLPDPVDGYGGCFGQDPAAYADLLRAAYGAVKDADPRAMVMFGAVAYDRFADHPQFLPKGPFRYEFVSDVLGELARDHLDEPRFPFFDGIGFHNYNDFRHHWDGEVGQYPEIIGKAKHLRDNQLVAPGLYDLRGVPLTCTEAGIASAPSDPYTARSESYQAAYVGQVMVRSMAAGLEMTIWYTMQDNATGECDDPWSWLTVGLLRSQWVADRAAQCDPNPLPGYAPDEPHQPKAAHAAFRTASDILSDAQYDRQLTAQETGAVEIEAHRVTMPGGVSAIVAFTDNGERLGRIGAPVIVKPFSVDADLLPGWTGRVLVVDYLGRERLETGDSVTVELTLEPTYLLVVR